MDSYRLNELPTTYARCKKYTQDFTEWLFKTARARRIEVDEYNKDPAHDYTNKGNRKKEIRIPLHRLVPLAQEIALSGPIEDKSGLDDLSDAIRTRKEVTQWFKGQGKSDVEHPFFIEKLKQVQDIFCRLYRSLREEHDLPVSKLISIPNSGPFDAAEDESDDEEEVPIVDDSRVLRPSQKPSKAAPGPRLTKEQITFEQKYQTLCFLYNFNRLREFVKQTWVEFGERKVSLTTAALVTDLALGIIQRDVAALLEELHSLDEQKSLVDIIEELYTLLTNPEEETHSRAVESQANDMELAQLLCMDALKHMQEYGRIKSSIHPQTDSSEGQLERMPFLLAFDHARPPIMDNFTRAIKSFSPGDEAQLTFGLQIIMDIQDLFRDPFLNEDLCDDIMEQNKQTSEAMRDHCEYEDGMWAAGIKPEYMHKGDTKFTNVFFPLMTAIVSWLEQLSNDKAAYMHPVLSGLVTYHFSRQYQMLAISKTTWFWVSLIHLYNACRQIGGLSVSWPDLEYMIETHGDERVFVGARPRDPQLFYGRWTLGLSLSSRALVEDGIRRNTREDGTSRNIRWARADKATKAKRGLLLQLPMGQKLGEYYYKYNRENRWIRLHNLFAYALHEQEAKGSPSKCKTSAELENLFASIFASLGRRNMFRKNQRKANRKLLTGSLREYIYADLLVGIKDTLCKQEVHSGFDYLSFYRCAFSLVLDIREGVLFDSKTALASMKNMEEEPTNFTLLNRLFVSLLLKPKKKGVGAEGDELSKDVVPIEQLQKIAVRMHEMIGEEGRAELDKAESYLRRWWDTSEPLDTTEDAEVPEDTEVPEPTPAWIERPKGIFHTFTYSSTVSRKRRLVIYREGPYSFLRSVKTACGYCTRLVGKKKHRVAFRCIGKCSLGSALCGHPSRLGVRKMEVVSEKLKYWIGRAKLESDWLQSLDERAKLKKKLRQALDARAKLETDFRQSLRD
jgi:hypothetical protein